MLKRFTYLLVALALLATPALLAAAPSQGEPLGETPPPVDTSEIPLDDIHRTGPPNFDLVKEFHLTQEETFGQRVWHLLDHTARAPEGPTEDHPIVAVGFRLDGYYCIMLDKDSWNENWDIIDRTVEQLKELGGEYLPIAFAVTGPIRGLLSTVEDEEAAGTESNPSSVTGGDRCFIYDPVLDHWNGATFSYRSGYNRFVTTGHFEHPEEYTIAMPLTAIVFDVGFDWRGDIYEVGGIYSDTSHAESTQEENILSGIRHYGDRIPIDTWDDPPYESVVVFKTGGTTGTTAGSAYMETDYWCPWHETVLPDQWLADFDVYFGDSGAPVYRSEILPGWERWTCLVGVLWGGPYDEDADEFEYAIFSPISGVLSDLTGAHPSTGL